MVTDYERRDFWKPIEQKEKVQILKCNNEKSWYRDKVGQVFEVDSKSIRDYYVVQNGTLRCILAIDAKIVE